MSVWLNIINFNRIHKEIRLKKIKREQFFVFSEKSEKNYAQKVTPPPHECIKKVFLYHNKRIYYH